MARNAFKLSDLVPDVIREPIYPPFDELTMLVYGPQGSGKTSFFGNSGEVLILSTEPGARFQSTRVREIYRFWPDPAGKDKRLDFETMVDGILAAHAEGKLKKLGIKLLVIDTVDALFEMAKWKALMIYNRNNPKSKYEHPDHITYGNGNLYGLQVIVEAVKKLQAVIPIAFISHEKIETVEVEDASGVKSEIERRNPSVHWRVAEWLSGIQNLVGYAYKSAGGQFYIKFHSDARLETKDRTKLLEAHGRPIKTEWKAVVDAYNAQAEKKGIVLRSRWS